MYLIQYLILHLDHNIFDSDIWMLKLNKIIP